MVVETQLNCSECGSTNTVVEETDVEIDGLGLAERESALRAPVAGASEPDHDVTGHHRVERIVAARIGHVRRRTVLPRGGNEDASNRGRGERYNPSRPLR